MDYDFSDNAVALTQSLMKHLTDSWKAQAIHVAASLRLPDFLAEHPKTCTELASSTNCHAPSLQRLLNALITLDICREEEDGTYHLTPLGNHLRSDAEPSLHAWAIWWGHYSWPMWGNLLYSIQTGKSARTLLLGTKGFEHLAKDSQAAEIFNTGLMNLTRMTAEQLVKAYDFSAINQLVDVGGGYGGLLCPILQVNPDMKGILFDQDHAKEGATQQAAKYGVSDQFEFQSGDFFVSESLPQNADAYILKNIIHDWNDERSQLILNNCRKAMASNGRVLLIEHVVPDKLAEDPRHQAIICNDLHMLAALAAQERTEEEYRILLQSADLKINQIIPVDMAFHLIEAVAIN